MRKLALFFLFFSAVFFCAAQDMEDGFVRLVLDQKQGSFALYYLTDITKREYEPLFYSVDPSTSFISIMVDDIAYNPSKSNYFINRVETPRGQPSLVFESSFALIRQIFTPVKTPSSDNINGIQITTTIQNKRNRDAFIGLRMLIDTKLGEERGRIPFITNNLAIRNETVINGKSGELYWLSRGKNASLMGSIINPLDSSARSPDYLHFANWKRLYDADWDLKPAEKRSFHYLPYSINDSAVCYYFLPVKVGAGESISLSIFLTTADSEWYERASARTQSAFPVQIPVPEIPEAPVLDALVEYEPAFIAEPEIIEAAPDEEPSLGFEIDLTELFALQDELNRFIAGEIELTEDDLFEIERNIDRLKNGL